MKLEDVTVGMSVIYSYLGDEDKGIVTRIDGNKVWAIWHNGNEQYVSASSIEPDHVPTQQSSLANTKIDAQKYADTYGLTLEEAHREIQPWLFGQGCAWCSGAGYVNCTFARWIEVGVIKGYSPTHITWSSEGYSTAKEITLLRNVSVSLSIAPTEPSVEIDGKQYTKAQLLEALAKLEGK